MITIKSIKISPNIILIFNNKKFIFIFKGARILVSDALELVEAGYDPDAVAQQYRGAITADAVREAISLTQQGMVKEDWSRNPA